MLKLIFSQKGAGILEVVIAAAVGGIVLAGLANQYVVGQRLSSSISKYENLDQILKVALVEIENIDPGSRPPIGTCRVRIYKGDGSQLSESDKVGMDCEKISAESSGFVLAWQVKDQSEIHPKFSDPNLMKLPTVVPSVSPIEVFGKYKDHGRATVRTKRYVIYGAAK